MSTPIPGRPVRGSKSGQPIMALFDLLGRSWALGIIWNLGTRSRTFRQLQTVCESVSPTTLNTRLKELRNSHMIESTINGYRLTKSGIEVLDLLKPLGSWANKWSDKFNQSK